MRTVVSNPAYQGILWFSSIWIEILFHKSFGQRYLLKDNWKAVTWALFLPFGVFAEPSLNEFSPFAVYFFGLVSVRCLFELSRLAIAKLKGKAPHYYDMGRPMRPWLFLFPDLNLVSRYIEPMIAVLAGIALIATQADPLLGYVHCWCGVGMFMKFQHLDVAQRDARKDVEDRKGEVKN